MRLSFLFYIIQISCNLRLVPFLKKDGALKSINQIENTYKSIKTIFNIKNGCALCDNWNMDIYQYMDGAKVAAFMQIKQSRGYKSGERFKIYSYIGVGSKRIEVPFISFYCVSILGEYKGKGLCKKFFIDVINNLKEKYKLPEDSILTLHISPKDIDMPISMRVYYKLGFKNGIFCKHGPSDYRYKIDDMFKYSIDLYEIADNPEKGNGEGFYVLLYCKLSDFGKNYISPANYMEKGKKLYNFCKDKINHKK